MKIEVEISEVNVSEDDYIRKFLDDWGYTRRKRIEKNMSFADADLLTYTIATITSPEEYKGKIAGYSGVGEYQDLLVDTGTYVLGGVASSKFNTPDFRGQGISTKLRNKRDAFAEQTSRGSKKPFSIIVSAGPNGYTRNLESKGYVLYDKELPEWAINRLGEKYYLVYNSNREVKKSWKGILKFDRDKLTPDEILEEEKRKKERKELARGKMGGEKPKKMGHIKNRGTWKWGEIEPTIYNKTGERARVMPRSIMLDYFKMYKRMHNRVPTLEEIEEEEERPLTVDEIEEYHREYMRTMG